MSKKRKLEDESASTPSSMAGNPIPSVAAEAVLVQSVEMPADSVKVKGYDFNQGVDYHKILQSYLTSGFQATNFGLVVEEINKMVSICIKMFLQKIF